MKVKELLQKLENIDLELEIVSSYTIYHDPDNDLDTSEQDTILEGTMVIDDERDLKGWIKKPDKIYFSFKEKE